MDLRREVDRAAQQLRQRADASGVRLDTGGEAGAVRADRQRLHLALELLPVDQGAELEAGGGQGPLQGLADGVVVLHDEEAGSGAHGASLPSRG